MSSPKDTRAAKAVFERREGASRGVRELTSLVQRLTERVERGRIYERSIAAGNDALQAELEQTQAELSRVERRAAR